jgi:hypothetical protein
MLAAGLLTAAAVLGAPQASADPQDLVPHCSGDQTPMNSNCEYAPDQQRGAMEGAPGANPGTPLGLTPLDEPAV